MVWRIDPRRGRLQAAIPLPGQVSALTVDQGSIWIHNGVPVGTVGRVDPAMVRRAT